MVEDIQSGHVFFQKEKFKPLYYNVHYITVEI